MNLYLKVNYLLNNLNTILGILLLLLLLGGILIFYPSGEILLIGLALAGLATLILLIRRPELSLAILFNGVFIYLYLVFRIGYKTSRLMTGGFYALLAFSYIIGGIMQKAKSRHKFFFGSIDLLFTCFFILIYLNYLIFNKGNESAYLKISYAPLLVIAPYVGIRLLSSEYRINNFINNCLLVVAILIIPAFYELLFNPIFANSTRFSMYMFDGGLNNPILFGITFAIALIILSIRMLEKRKLIYKYLVLMVPSIYLLLRSGSRGAVIAFIFTMIIYFLFVASIRINTKLYVTLFSSLLIVGLYKYIPESTVGFYEYTTTHEAQLDKGSSVYIRIDMWKQAINDFIKNPILGVGIGNSVEGTGSPHNIILEVSAELGLLGILIFLSMCYLTIKKAMRFIKIEKSKDFKLLMKISILLFIYSLTEAMFSGYITDQTQLFMSMGIVISLINVRHSRNSTKSWGNDRLEVQKYN